MKHSLQLKLSQPLTLTPQLQQSIRLLQLSTIELNQELERYLADNPLLERADPQEGETSAPPSNGASPSVETRPANEPRDDAPAFADDGGGFGDDAPAGGSSRVRRRRERRL